MRWAALLDAGNIVGMLAGIEAKQPGKDLRNFPALMRDCEDWRRELAENGITDLAAIMEAGLVALLAISARGGDCRVAAETLWREYLGARALLLDLLPPTGALGPMRSA